MQVRRDWGIVKERGGRKEKRTAGITEGVGEGGKRQQGKEGDKKEGTGSGGERKKGEGLYLALTLFLCSIIQGFAQLYTVCEMGPMLVNA